MEWLRQLILDDEAIASCLFILALVIASGLALGSLRFRGIRLGVAGVLFSGLVFGHFHLTVNPTVLDFAREFGLILFVYAIGLAVGPGFFNALKASGLKLNLMAAGIVLVGLLVTVLISRVGGVSMPIAVGIFSGATTNTPSLAAASQALREHPLDSVQAQKALTQAGIKPTAAAASLQQIQGEVAALPGLGYAVSYPFGVVGLILTMVGLRYLFRVNPVEEAAALQALLRSRQPPLERMNLVVKNPNLDGIRLEEIPGLDALDLVISRVWHEGKLRVAQPQQPIAVGDVLLAVGSPDRLEQLRMIVGDRAEVDLFQVPSQIAYRWILVTQKRVVGQALDELRLRPRFGVQITRVRRAQVEMPPVENVRLELGDQVLVVGMPEAVAAVAQELGDSPKQLEQPEIIPVFVGIALGIILGSLPITIPGMPSAVKLGLAGGPLLVAILLSRLHRIGPLVFYLPRSASFLLRDLGIVIFLAAVGIKSGERFVGSLTEGDGLLWLLSGMIVTLVPLFVVSLVAHWWLQVKYTTLVGVLAGSMTDPPGLAFANGQTESEMPAVAYATVYPLAMILRTLCAQAMILTWVS